MERFIQKVENSKIKFGLIPDSIVCGITKLHNMKTESHFFEWKKYFAGEENPKGFEFKIEEKDGEYLFYKREVALNRNNSVSRWADARSRLSEIRNDSCPRFGHLEPGQPLHKFYSDGSTNHPEEYVRNAKFIVEKINKYKYHFYHDGKLRKIKRDGVNIRVDGVESYYWDEDPYRSTPKCKHLTLKTVDDSFGYTIVKKNRTKYGDCSCQVTLTEVVPKEEFKRCL